MFEQSLREYGERTPMHYGAAIAVLNEFVDDDTIVLGDIGQHNQWGRLAVTTRGRNTFVPEGYWGAMGFCIPAAMAAKAAYPDNRVIAVTVGGDRSIPAGPVSVRFGSPAETPAPAPAEP